MATEKKDRISILLELTKFRLVALVLWSTAVGYVLAEPRQIAWAHFFHALLATGMVASGSLALNQWVEKDLDALMKRTAKRPLPSGRIKSWQAAVIGFSLSAVGLVYLYFAANLLSAFLSGLTLVTYIFLYTPLKTRTSLNTIAGAVPGALPPMIGWAAARGELSFGAWILFGILFLWQIPHFLAIAWLYREEYKKAGFIMISGNEENGGMVARQAVVSSAMLLPVSLLPTLFGLTGMVYFATAMILGLALLGISLAGLRDIEKNSRPLFLMSIVYLSLLLLMMLIDRHPYGV